MPQRSAIVIPMTLALDRIAPSFLERQAYDLLRAPWRMLESGHKKAIDDLRALTHLMTRLKGRKGTSAELERVGKALEFFSKDLLKHMDTEETIVFPFLGKNVSTLAGSVNELTSEHQRFRRLLPQLTRSHQAVQQRPSSQRRWFCMAREGLLLVSLLQSHIAKEIRLMNGLKGPRVRAQPL